MSTFGLEMFQKVLKMFYDRSLSLHYSILIISVLNSSAVDIYDR